MSDSKTVKQTNTMPVATGGAPVVSNDSHLEPARLQRMLAQVERIRQEHQKGRPLYSADVLAQAESVHEDLMPLRQDANGYST